MGDIHRLQSAYSGRFRCLFVYILEAHAEDEWPIGGAVKFQQPTTLERRCAVAREFIEGMSVEIPVLVDAVEEDLQDEPNPDAPQTFQELYAGWPVRLYIIDSDSTIRLIPEPSDCAYEVGDITKWVEANVGQP